MLKTQAKKRKQDLGIFYTPQQVVNFVFDILNIWKEREDKETKRWQSRKPQAHFPSVIDPACGEGVFLKTAVISGLTGYHPTEKTPYVFGVDLDGEVVKRWEKISILHDLFKGNKDKMLNHFHQQDGLLELPEKVFNYKTGGLKEFDAVVGNPPYGGMGFSSLKDKNTKETIEILEHLKKFEILGYRKRKNEKENGQTPLWGDFTWGSMPWGCGSRIPDTKEIESTPIEMLFLDRFIQLAKPGGWIAIIIPDGILTNSNSHYVREFLSDKTKIEAIISLPRETFKNVGTNAKTSILFLRKIKEIEKPEKNYNVFLASVEKINKDNFDLIVKSYEKFYNLGETHMNKSDFAQITNDQTGREAVMIRTDKTLKQLMEEKPSSRWNSEYWHPKYDELIVTMSKNQLKRLDDFKIVLTSGYRGTLSYSSSGIPSLKVRNVLDSGVDLVDIDYLPQNSPANTVTKTTEYGDLIINRSGTGSIGRMAIFLSEDLKVIITGDVYLLRLKGINPFYVNIFLKTLFGKMQIHRFESGVSGQTKIDLEEILNIYIPILSTILQTKIEEKHKEFSIFHNKAMEAKRSGDKKSFKDNLGTAEKMLKELIKKTEEVIRGERDDIN